MKKLIVLIIALVLLLSSAAAESNNPLADYSLDELLFMRRTLDKVLFNHPDVKSVTVPEGIYKIGEDIPAGDYDIIAVSGEMSSIVYFEHLDPLGYTYKEGEPFQWEIVSNMPDNDVKSYHFHFDEGNYVRVSLAPAIFTTYTGPKFTFE